MLKVPCSSTVTQSQSLIHFFFLLPAAPLGWNWMEGVDNLTFLEMQAEALGCRCRALLWAYFTENVAFCMVLGTSFPVRDWHAVVTPAPRAAETCNTRVGFRPCFLVEGLSHLRVYLWCKVEVVLVVILYSRQFLPLKFSWYQGFFPLSQWTA